MRNYLRSNRTLFFVFVLLLVLGVFGYSSMGQTSFVRTSLSGLTLGALYFMVAAGLTLVFGLMDVLSLLMELPSWLAPIWAGNFLPIQVSYSVLPH